MIQDDSMSCSRRSSTSRPSTNTRTLVSGLVAAPAGRVSVLQCRLYKLLTFFLATGLIVYQQEVDDEESDIVISGVRYSYFDVLGELEDEELYSGFLANENQLTRPPIGKNASPPSELHGQSSCCSFRAFSGAASTSRTPKTTSRPVPSSFSLFAKAAILLTDARRVRVEHIVVDDQHQEQERVENKQTKFSFSPTIAKNSAQKPLLQRGKQKARRTTAARAATKLAEGVELGEDEATARAGVPLPLSLLVRRAGVVRNRTVTRRTIASSTTSSSRQVVLPTRNKNITPVVSTDNFDHRRSRKPKSTKAPPAPAKPTEEVAPQEQQQNQGAAHTLGVEEETKTETETTSATLSTRTSLQESTVESRSVRTTTSSAPPRGPQENLHQGAAASSTSITAATGSGSSTTSSTATSTTAALKKNLKHVLASRNKLRLRLVLSENVRRNQVKRDVVFQNAVNRGLIDALNQAIDEKETQELLAAQRTTGA
ncbi:unnamed protein product, partial [Amoebophrya sp. A120]|eukprot:GSA120T00012398001.1